MPYLKLLLIAIVTPFILLPAEASAKTYWHFTFTISRASDQSEREWAWITMVEIPRARAYPEEATAVRRMGGTFEGTRFAFVRGAAWRAAHTETKTIDCGNFSRGTLEKFWHESESESVYAHGGLPNDADFSILINERPVLREDGSWFDPKSEPHTFVGPIRMEGGPEIKIKGDYVVLGINYSDPNEHHRKTCPNEKEREWVRQYHSKLIQFSSGGPLRDNLIGNSIFGQKYVSAHGNRYHLVYQVERSNSSRHPHWKRQEM